MWECECERVCVCVCECVCEREEPRKAWGSIFTWDPMAGELITVHFYMKPMLKGGGHVCIYSLQIMYIHTFFVSCQRRFLGFSELILLSLASGTDY